MKSKNELRSELKRDEDFLKSPEKWGRDEMGSQRVCVKTWSESPQRFGIIYADTPLTVWINPPVAHIVSGKGDLTSVPEKFETVENLVDTWMVD